MRYYNSIASVILAYKNQYSPDGRNSGQTIYFKGDVLYSYGEHFPLAVRTQDNCYILNGDKYSVTTSRHQSYLMRAIQGTNRVEIPFSALNTAFGNRSARYYRDLEIIDQTQDRFYATDRVNKFGEIIMEHQLGGCLFIHTDNPDDHWLSGIDDSGAGRGMYFLTKLLPEHKPTTVAEAFECMKPEQVKEAEAKGLTVRRQGEFFFVETKVNFKYFDSPTKDYIIENQNPDRERRHIANYGFKLGDNQFVLSIVRHTEREHRMLKLYDGEQVKLKDKLWHMVYEGLQSVSYSAVGAID